MNCDVMIVEDNDKARAVMQAALSAAGFTVAAVADGAAALELLHHRRFRLVLLDVHMPQMSGLQVLAAMATLKSRPPVVMVSANTADETVREALSLGCSGYLAKPFTPIDLIERARWAVAGPVSLTMH